ncbi:hypothetical protein HDU81_001308 [Chytriomyces hyalinus]|nr:hypothetical protein HDU81_001308 [Chytriomyces hyalinus]
MLKIHPAFKRKGLAFPIIVAFCLVISLATFNSQPSIPPSHITAAASTAFNLTPSAYPIPIAPAFVNSIPLIIHQTYKTNLPSLWKAERPNRSRYSWFMSWRKVNPDAMHIVWTDAQADEFMRSAFPGTRFYEAYQKLPRVVLKTDMLRYALLLKYGGVYSDGDTTCRRPLQDWFVGHDNATLIVGVEWYANFHKHHEDHYKQLQLVQWTFAASAGHPMFDALLTDISKRVLDEYSEEYLLNRDNVESIGGPRVFTRFVREYMAEFNESFELLDVSQEDGKGYFAKSRVLVHPMYSFYPAYAKRLFTRRTDLVDHHFYGASSEGWKFI